MASGLSVSDGRIRELLTAAPSSAAAASGGGSIGERFVDGDLASLAMGHMLERSEADRKLREFEQMLLAVNAAGTTAGSSSNGNNAPCS